VIVSARHEVLASVPLHQLDQIVILDNAMVSTALLRHCARHRVKVAIAGWATSGC
jgi:CRISP-associated protein Cas1